MKCLEREIAANRSAETALSIQSARTGTLIATLRGPGIRVLTVLHGGMVMEMEAVALAFNKLLKDYRKANP